MYSTLPIDSMGRDEVTLRVVSGSQSGASMVLVEGSTYTVGSNMSADIILYGDSIEAEHLTLKLTDKTVRIITNDGSVLIDDSLLEANQKRDLPLESNFKIGEAVVFIGSESYQSQCSEGDKKYAHTSDGQLTKDIKRRRVWVGKRGQYGAIAVGLFSLCAATIFASSEGQVVTSADSLLASVVVSVEDLDIKRQHVYQNSDHTVVVAGHVDSGEQLDSVYENLKMFGSKVNIEVRSRTNIELETMNLLGTLGIESGVNVRLSDAGELQFSGQVRDRDEWERTVSTLVRDLPEISGYDDTALKTYDDVIKEIEGHLKQFNTVGNISVVRIGDDIMIRGSAESRKMPKLHNVLQKMKEKFAGNPALMVQITKVEDPLADLTIKLVSHSEEPYMILDNGERFAEGDMLDNGFTVEKIKTNNIVLVKSGEKIEINI